MCKTMTVWTRQVPQVWDEIRQNGVYCVKEAYIREKNDSIAEYYIDLYKWYTQKCRDYVQIPENLDYPIWLSLTEAGKLPLAENTVTFTLEIPVNQIFITNYDKWGYRVNYWYVPVDAADEAQHNQELKNYGIENEAALIQTSKGNFYPQLKQKIIKSWDRLFTIPPASLSDGVGTSWEIRKEWIKDVQVYG